MDHRNHILGRLCKHGHESEPGSGSSWRYVVKGKTAGCVECAVLCKRRYASSSKGREVGRKTSQKYRSSEKGRARDARTKERRQLPEEKLKRFSYNRQYAASEGGREVREACNKRYRKSEKGQKTRSQYQRRYNSENRERLNASRRKKYASDPGFALSCRLRTRLWEAFQAHSLHGKARSSDEYGVNYQAIIDHLGPCPGERCEYHIDHIQPLSSFDWDDPDTPSKAFAPENHQWLYGEENLRKSNSMNENEVKNV